MKRAELGQIVKYESHLLEVVAIGDGRSVTLRQVNPHSCPTCGRTTTFNFLEHSSLFQSVKPVKTVEAR